MNQQTELDGIAEAIVQGEEKRVEALVQRALESGIAPETLMEDGLMRAMSRVGELYETREYYVPEVLLSAMSMKAGLSLLRPLLSERSSRGTGRVVVGTVRGDVHDIGKNIVALSLEGAGFDVINLGADVPAETFAESAVARDADIIGMSALLTTTRVVMPEVIRLLDDSKARERVKVLIGGAAVSERFAMEIGADGYGRDAVHAVKLAREMT